MTTYHESFIDSDYELVDDGTDPESVALDHWTEDLLSTVPAVTECDNCHQPTLAVWGPFVADIAEGHALRRPGAETYVCDVCVETALDEGWRRW